MIYLLCTGDGLKQGGQCMVYLPGIDGYVHLVFLSPLDWARLLAHLVEHLRLMISSAFTTTVDTFQTSNGAEKRL
jgi:hypothetical protein